MPGYKRILPRLGILILIIGIQSLYAPLNQNLSGGIAPFLWLDALIRLHPIWVFPYLLALPIWVVSLIWGTIRMDARTYRIMAVAALIAVIVGVTTYAVFPTYVIRPEITSQTLGSNLLRWVYAHDQPYNALPSSHVYLTLLCGLLWMRWKPRGRLIWLAGVLTICLSTLFTKQHYLLDVICGALLAGLAYILAIGIDRWWENQKAQEVE